MLDGPDTTVIPTIDSSDAALAVAAAVAMAPAGAYEVTDGSGRTQGELSDALVLGFGHKMQPLYDARWGNGRLLGSTRYAHSTEFSEAVGWVPRFPDPVVRFEELARARSRG